MILFRILQSLGLVCFLVTLGACSGGTGQEPIEAQAVNAPEPAPPTDPPAEPPPPTAPPPVNPRPLPPPDATPPPQTEPTGIWTGTNSDGLQVVLIGMPDAVEHPTSNIGTENAQFWLIYSQLSTAPRAERMIAGAVTTTATTWTMSDGRFFNDAWASRGQVQGQGTWASRTRLNGTLTITIDPGSGTPPTTERASLTYHAPLSERPFSLAEAAGTYTGRQLPQEGVIFQLASNGTFTGRLLNTGCAFSGSATPTGPVADISFAFTGPEGTCFHHLGESLHGVLSVDTTTGQLVAAAMIFDRAQGFVLIGQRQ